MRTSFTAAARGFTLRPLASMSRPPETLLFGEFSICCYVLLFLRIWCNFAVLLHDCRIEVLLLDGTEFECFGEIHSEFDLELMFVGVGGWEVCEVFGEMLWIFCSLVIELAVWLLFY